MGSAIPNVVCKRLATGLHGYRLLTGGGVSGLGIQSKYRRWEFSILSIFFVGLNIYSKKLTLGMLDMLDRISGRTGDPVDPWIRPKPQPNLKSVKPNLPESTKPKRERAEINKFKNQKSKIKESKESQPSGGPRGPWLAGLGVLSFSKVYAFVSVRRSLSLGGRIPQTPGSESQNV